MCLVYILFELQRFVFLSMFAPKDYFYCQLFFFFFDLVLFCSFFVFFLVLLNHTIRLTILLVLYVNIISLWAWPNINLSTVTKIFCLWLHAGLRYIPLRTPTGVLVLHSGLFVRIKIQEFEPASDRVKGTSRERLLTFWYNFGPCIMTTQDGCRRVSLVHSTMHLPSIVTASA